VCGCTHDSHFNISPAAAVADAAVVVDTDADVALLPRFHRCGVTRRVAIGKETTETVDVESA
jgi:hypothetical protein